MKQFIVAIIFLLMVSIGINAQEFHPYKVKSGKIIFEKKKYSMYTRLHIDSNGNASGSRSNPSYVEEEVIYYWDNYGDIAYEVGYQVSKFGGELLPKKVKKYERLWKGEHRYYYDVKKKKVYDDPYYTRNKCFRKGYQVNGWLKTMYPHASLVVKESVAGKMVNHYKESEYWDFYEWNEIILRNVSYSTKKKNGKYKRFEPKSERVAVKVEADIKVDASVFNPKWLKHNDE